MFPVISITLPSYTLMATIGVIVSVIFLYCRMEKFDIAFKQLIEYIIVCVFLMIINSKLLFAVAKAPQNIYDFVENFINGGIVFYGGMLGVILGIVLVSKARGDNLINIMNFAVPAIPLFHIFGRIGCLFAGCCYGIEWSWGVIMASMPDRVRFPVQLVESICNIIIFTSLIIVLNRKKHINILPIYLVEYAICRFILEFFRGDKIRGIWGLLSTSQIISLIIVFATIGYFANKKILKL